MKKSIIAILLLSIIAVMASTPAVNSVCIVTSDAYRVSEVVKDYLFEAAYNQYLYESRDLDKYTIASVPDNRSSELSEALSGYPEFRSERSNLLHNNAFLCSADVSSFRSNLDLHKNSIEHYAYLGKASNSEYKYFTPRYQIIKVDVNESLASVELCEELDFQYVELDDDSIMLTHFFISLVENNGHWLILSVESDDAYYESQMMENGAIKLEKDLEATVYQSYNKEDDEDSENDDEPRIIVPPDPGFTDRVYDPVNAVNYALTFTKGGSDYGISGASTWANSYFYHSAAGSDGGNCMRFANECIWAGLGGSNTATDISNKHMMDNQGSTAYQKWYGVPTYSGQNHPWISNYYFNGYIQSVDFQGTQRDLICKVSEVGINQNNLTAGTMTQGASITASELLGSVIQMNGHLGEFSHAAIITACSDIGSVYRTELFASAYSKCYRNIKLSIIAPFQGSSASKVRVIVPLYMRNGNSSGGNYLYGRLLPALQSGDQRTVIGYSATPVSSLKLKIYNPSNVLVYTVTATNSSTVSKTLTFTANSDGELWRIEVSSTGLSSYTYLVRVTNSSNSLQNASSN